VKSLSENELKKRREKLEKPIFKRVTFSADPEVSCEMKKVRVAYLTISAKNG
jgi:hypothetical protein